MPSTKRSKKEVSPQLEDNPNCEPPFAWPPNYEAEYERRRKHIEWINEDFVTRTVALKLFYAVEPVKFIEDWCTTYDPRNKAPLPRNMPFLLFPRQKQMVEWVVECINNGESGLCEKSRDAGATWLCAAISLWLYLFHPGSAIGWGSRKQDLVDRLGDPGSIFEKIRILLFRMPKFLMPEGFNRNIHCTFMKVINPENGSSIVGESGKAIGRGGRTTVFFKDESAHYEQAESIEAALSENTDVQIDISSVNGPANVFYRKRKAGEVWEPGKEIESGITRVFIMDWKHHPGKDQSWYDKKRAKAEREGLYHLFAQEVDRDYTASVDRLLIPLKHVKAAIDAHKVLKFKPEGERIAGLDVADEGGDKNALAGRHGVVLQFTKEWAEGDTGETANIASDVCKVRKYKNLQYDCIGVGAGVKAEANRLHKENLLHHVKFHPWNASNPPQQPNGRIIEGDNETPRNSEYFISLKAQSYWRLAQRFEKTYKAVVQGKSYPPEELISIDSDIDNLDQIEMELCQIRILIQEGTGKMKIDKQPDGASSPNVADSINICYNPVRANVRAGVW